MSVLFSQRWALTLLVKPHLQGWRRRGRGSNGGGTSETLSCWESQGKGRGWRRGRVGGGLVRGVRDAFALSWGLRVRSSQPPWAQPLRSLQLQLIAAPESCASSTGHQRELSACFPNFAALRREPLPSWEPLAHLFSSVVFFFFSFLFLPFSPPPTPLGRENTIWSLAFVRFSPPGPRSRKEGWGESTTGDAQGKLSPRLADYKPIGARVEKGDLTSCFVSSFPASFQGGLGF